MTATIADIISTEIAQIQQRHQPKQAHNVKQALHRPNSPYDAQRDQDDMIRAMHPRSYFGADRQQEIDRYQNAVQYMRAQDAARVRNFTNLKSPFPKTS